MKAYNCTILPNRVYFARLWHGTLGKNIFVRLYDTIVAYNYINKNKRESRFEKPMVSQFIVLKLQKYMTKYHRDSYAYKSYTNLKDKIMLKMIKSMYLRVCIYRYKAYLKSIKDFSSLKHLSGYNFKDLDTRLLIHNNKIKEESKNAN